MLIEQEQYNPDVLSCIANLSSDEVFTPPEVANQMLDLLPDDLWRDKTATFLDPGCKSGVFLREIAKRLDAGLEPQIPDRQTRLNHIFKKQLFAIAITELTGLVARRSVYCSKTANGEYSVCDDFEDPDGNIRFERIEHTWNSNGRCDYCGASKEGYERDEALETHAYELLHTENPAEIFNMKFDVIIGNPPYQLSDGGYGRSASPIYHRFVQQAKKLKPKYLSMVIPARWYSGGKGLNSFREEMLGDAQIRTLVDHENSADIFPGVDIAGGICYFLWCKDDPGKCDVINFDKDEEVRQKRDLNEFPVFIRNSKAVSVIKKVNSFKENNEKKLSYFVSSRKPFGLPTNYKPKKKGVPCWFTQKTGLQFADPDDITDKNKIADRWKVLIPPAPIAGQTDFSKPVTFYYRGNTRIAKPGEYCSESWLVAGSFKTKTEALNFRSYLFTKIVRFLLLQTVVSQHVTREKFIFVPYLSSYKTPFTDDVLRKRWGINDEEWSFIDSKIRNVDENG